MKSKISTEAQMCGKITFSLTLAKSSISFVSSLKRIYIWSMIFCGFLKFETLSKISETVSFDVGWPLQPKDVPSDVLLPLKYLKGLEYPYSNSFPLSKAGFRQTSITTGKSFSSRFSF